VFGSSSTVDFGFKDVDASDKESLVRDVFSRVANTYDVMNDAMSVGTHRLWKDHFVDAIGIPASAAADRSSIPRHLDVAGGTGDIAFRVMQQYAQCYKDEIVAESNAPDAEHRRQEDRRIVVCDINPDMLKVGAKRAASVVGAANSNMIGFLEGNAEKLPFADDSFDVYTIAFGLRNVTDKDRALADAYRVLRKGGRIMILEFSHLDNAAMQFVYDQYSFKVIPKLGELIANDAASYQYLVESIRKFPKQDELKGMLERAGFSFATYENLQFGIVSIHSGFKL
jgi:2-methoxy-6-polyprenyl-1,4-benzoquinol methylase